MLVRRSDIGASLANAIGLCVAALGLLILTGCAATESTSMAGSLAEIGPAQLKACNGADLRAEEPGQSVFRGTEQGEGGQRRLIIKRGPMPGGGEGGYQQQRFLVEGGKETLIREQKLLVREDGAVVLAEEINHAEGVEVVFDPPLVVLPASIETSSTVTSEGRMTVHPLGDRSRVRAKGTVKDSSTCLGAWRISTPAGEFDAWKLTSTFDANLGASRVQNETEIWVVPGIGIVSERRREKTMVFGVAIRNNAESWLIIEAPVAAAGGWGSGGPKR